MRLKLNQHKIGRRIVPRRRGKDLGAVLLFCILLPYVIASLTGKVKIDGELHIEDGLMVIYESDNGTEKIPLETYLVGALAASVPDDFEAEAIKAQAVLLRTNILRIYQNGGSSGKNEIELKNIGQEYMTVSQMKRKWNVDFKYHYERLQSLSAQVKGEKLSYQGILITAPYFYSSAGKTRNGNEVLGSEDFPYLKSVDCPTDILTEDCQYSITYTEDEFFEKLGKLIAEPIDKEKFWKTIKINRDEAGYVNTIMVGEQQLTGEGFRKEMGLRGACFELKQQDSSVKIETKGWGHGLGMSQCYANQMAQQGADYEEILKYFFSDVELMKE